MAANVYDVVTASESADIEIISKVDSYAFSNYSTWYEICSAYAGVCQSFTPSVTCILKSIWIQGGIGSGSPTGNVYAYMSTDGGTYGVSSWPDVLLATATPRDITLMGPWTEYEWEFPIGQQPTLEAGKHYVLTIWFSGGNASNTFGYGVDATSPSHSGNIAYTSDDTWYFYYSTTEDLLFEVYGEEVPDWNPSVNDAISLSEDVALQVQEGHGTSVKDEISISEYVDLEISGVHEAVTFDTVTVSESATVDPDKQISPYDAVSVAESATALIAYPISTDAVNNPKAPIASLEAEMTQRLEVDGKFPTPSLTAYSGAIESATAPVASLDAEITYEEGLTLDKKAPTSSLEAYSGAILGKTSPTAELEAESYSNYIKLDSKAPIAVVEATCYYLGSMTLSKTAPFWTIEAEMINAVFYLDTTAPVWYTTEITGYSYGYGEVDNYAPVWKALFEDLTLFDPGIDADMTAPVGTMREDTGMSDTDKAEGSYSDQYEVTLEYSR